MNRFMIAACLALTVSACAPATTIAPTDQARAPGSAKACFLPQAVTNFRAEDESLVYVRASRSEVFEIRSSPCFGMDSALSLSIVQPIGSGTRACVGDPVDLMVGRRGSSFRTPGSCRAEVVRQLTETEIAALPSRLRP